MLTAVQQILRPEDTTEQKKVMPKAKPAHQVLSRKNKRPDVPCLPDSIWKDRLAGLGGRNAGVRTRLGGRQDTTNKQKMQIASQLHASQD